MLPGADVTQWHHRRRKRKRRRPSSSGAIPSTGHSGSSTLVATLGPQLAGSRACRPADSLRGWHQSCRPMLAANSFGTVHQKGLVSTGKVLGPPWRWAGPCVFGRRARVSLGQVVSGCNSKRRRTTKSPTVARRSTSWPRRWRKCAWG